MLKVFYSDHFPLPLHEGTLGHTSELKIGIPCSRGLCERSAASVGGTLSAASCALEFGVAGNLAGGTHHAHRDSGEGFCVFHDIAVATRLLHEEFPQMKIAASILKDDPHVFTLSLHGEKNDPFKRPFKWESIL